MFKYFVLCLFPIPALAQLRWQNVDAEFGSLPKGLQVFRTTDSLDGKPFIAYYAEADLSNKKLHFAADTTDGRRMTPSQFYEVNQHPAVVVNCTFFEFVHQRNLNLVVNNGRLLAYNRATINGRGKDTFTYRHVYPSAIGISKKRRADIAWTFTDTSKKHVYAMQAAVPPQKDSAERFSFERAGYYSSIGAKNGNPNRLRKWKMRTAVGGGPVLLQVGKYLITNNYDNRIRVKTEE